MTLSRPSHAILAPSFETIYFVSEAFPILYKRSDDTGARTHIPSVDPHSVDSRLCVAGGRGQARSNLQSPLSIPRGLWSADSGGDVTILKMSLRTSRYRRQSKSASTIFFERSAHFDAIESLTTINTFGHCSDVKCSGASDRR